MHYMLAYSYTVVIIYSSFLLYNYTHSRCESPQELRDPKIKTGVLPNSGIFCSVLYQKNPIQYSGPNKQQSVFEMQTTRTSANNRKTSLLPLLEVPIINQYGCCAITIFWIINPHVVGGEMDMVMRSTAKIAKKVVPGIRNLNASPSTFRGTMQVQKLVASRCLYGQGLLSGAGNVVWSATAGVLVVCGLGVGLFR